MRTIRQWLRDWLDLAPTPAPPPPPPPPEIALETVKLIADVAVREYNNENDIQKSLDNKAATWIGATGAVLIFAVGTLGKIPVLATLFGARLWFQLAYGAAIVATILCLVVAEVWFVRAFTVRIYLRLDPQEWANFAEARRPPVDAYIRLAGDYNGIVQRNRAISEEKARLQRRGVRFFLAALAALLVVFGLGLWATW